MMGKFTVWLVVAGLAWLGWTLWRIGKRRSESGTTRQPDQAPASSTEQARQAPPADSPPEPMLRCAHCGLYLPAREAVSDTSGRSFCSTAHRDRAGPSSNNTPRQG
jgi:uncharacterized protein